MTDARDGWVRAGSATPGITVWNPAHRPGHDERELLEITTVSEPDSDGMVTLHTHRGPCVRLAADWGLDLAPEQGEHG